MYLGLVAAIEEAIEDASITLDRLKSETCKHAVTQPMTHEDLYIYGKEGGKSQSECDPLVLNE